MKLEIVIQPLGTIRIGAGAPPELLHLPSPLLRTKHQDSLVPVIPGSTIKGVMRKAALKFFDSAVKEAGFEVEYRPVETVQPDPLIEHYKATGGKDIVSNLFGRPHHRRAKIRVSDAVPRDPDSIIKVIADLPRVGIDRNTKTAAKGRLFQIERVAPAPEFVCELSNLENLTDPELLFLLEVIKHVPEVGIGSSSVPVSIKVHVKEPPAGGFSAKVQELLDKLQGGISV
jgi:CRISPR/Cas system CSM-associated protein Csm3 (group 7 of RAMP superfamily)